MKRDPVRITRNYEAMKKKFDDKKGANLLSPEPEEADYELAQYLAITVHDKDQRDNATDDEANDKQSVGAITTPFIHQKTCHIAGKRVLKPSMFVTVAGVTARALCDTGSDYSHVSGPFAKKLNHLKMSKWDRPRLYAVNDKEVTPRHQFNSVSIIHR